MQGVHDAAPGVVVPCPAAQLVHWALPGGLLVLLPHGKHASNASAGVAVRGLNVPAGHSVQAPARAEL